MSFHNFVIQTTGSKTSANIPVYLTVQLLQLNCPQEYGSWEVVLAREAEWSHNLYFTVFPILNIILWRLFHYLLLFFNIKFAKPKKITAPIWTFKWNTYKSKEKYKKVRDSGLVIYLMSALLEGHEHGPWIALISIKTAPFICWNYSSSTSLDYGIRKSTFPDSVTVKRFWVLFIFFFFRRRCLFSFVWFGLSFRWGMGLKTREKKSHFILSSFYHYENITGEEIF